jgi:hypothetical protein
VIWFANTSRFAVSPLGKILTFMVYAFRDGIVMVVQIALNFSSMFFLKQHLRKKISLHAITTPDKYHTRKPYFALATRVRTEVDLNLSHSDHKATTMVCFYFLL